ncbi:MAG: hypothetical protein OWS74_06980 [Firmicutes bacterium]|nr:hypothetical protein [Bacillota bacterium]
MMASSSEKTQEIIAILRASRDLGPDYDAATAQQIEELLDPSLHSPDALIRAFLAFSPRTQRHIIKKMRDYAHLSSPVRTGLFFLGLLAVSVPFLAIGAIFGRDIGILSVLSFDVLAGLMLWRIVR